MAVEPPPKTISFGGLNWNVRHSLNDSPPVQPGNNYFSSSYGKSESIYVDADGKLHLAIVRKSVLALEFSYGQPLVS